MNRRVLFCLALSTLVAALMSGCFAPVEPSKPAPPKEPDPNKTVSSFISEIRIAPAVVEAGKIALASAGYYLGNDLPSGDHSLSCAYPAPDGKSLLTESWTETASDVVNVHSFIVQVDQPGQFAVTCQVDNQSIKSAGFQVFKNAQTDIQAEVVEIDVRRSSGSSRERFNVTVGFIYGSAAEGKITCTYPAENGTTTQQVLAFTRPEPVEEYAGGHSQLLFDIIVKKVGQHQVRCRVDPGGKEQAAGFEVMQLEDNPPPPAAPDRVIRARLSETHPGSEHPLTLDSVAVLTYSAKDGMLTGTFSGEGTERFTGECVAGDKVIDNLVLDYVHTYQLAISTPLALGQEISIPFQPSVHRSTKIMQDYTVCGGGTSVTGPLEVDIPGSGTLTLLLAEDGSYRLSTQWDLWNYHGIHGTVSGQAQ